jgi:hypothetical protein
MFFRPLFHAGVTGDLGVEDKKTGVQIGHMSTYALAVLFEQRATLRLRAGAALPQDRITQHLPDRHSGRLQTIEKFDPAQNRCVIVPAARRIPVRAGDQPDPLIVTDGVSR